MRGQVRFFCADQELLAEPGAFIFLPKDMTHSFRVDSAGPARMLLVSVPGGIEGYFTEAGEPAAERSFPPPPGPPDMDRLKTIGRKYGIEFPGGKTPE